jgi:predicted XRE-type DNA-binding protein
VKKQPVGVGVSSGNVFADVGLENAEEELTKARLTAAIAKAIERRRFRNQTAVATALGIDQPKVSKLLRGHFAEYSVERLMSFLTRLGYDVRIEVSGRAHARRHGHLEVVEAA